MAHLASQSQAYQNCLIFVGPLGAVGKIANLWYTIQNILELLQKLTRRNTGTKQRIAYMVYLTTIIPTQLEQLTPDARRVNETTPDAWCEHSGSGRSSRF